ncbi:MAG: bifunctional folylpolyglutamate synthase/dihydrofolate synthase [Lachnospiraceae bacterium]|nr:bifunctional folylpolyglutamate synthase/dihydrofolate synthase [Lachnospiraceae bacterium]
MNPEEISYKHYLDALTAFDEASSYGIHPGLEGISALLEELGNPEKDLECIHIAGTNGKGSVSAYLRSIFCEAEYSVGTFNSPALEYYRERFLYKRRMISQKDFTRLAGVVASACKRVEKKGIPHPTQFEMDLGLAFLFFKEKNCHPVILECGMGGLMDATNIIAAPILAVITSISMDHQRFLGKTLRDIAIQKAGIIKQGSPVVSAPQEKEALEIIEEQARKQKSSLTIAEPENVSKIKSTIQGTALDAEISSLPGKVLHIQSPLAGLWQRENVLLALACANALQSRFHLTEKQILNGFEKTEWPCRFEVVRKKPLTILDGAHNPDAAKKLAETIRQLFALTPQKNQSFPQNGVLPCETKESALRKHLVFIVGMLRDKDAAGILKETLPLAEEVITLKPPGNPRALDAAELARIASEYHPKVSTADSVEEALELADLLAGKDGLIIAFGSLSYLAKLKRVIRALIK